MKRFTISKNSEINVDAMNGRKLIASRYDEFRTVGECICWAKRVAEQRGVELTEVCITDRFNEAYASYTPSGKRVE